MRRSLYGFALGCILACGVPLPSVRCDEPVPPLTVLNRGVGGQNSRDGRARFDRDVVAAQPGVVLIYFGLNDTLNEPKFVPLDAFVENIGWMIDRARQAHIVPVIATIHAVTEEPLYQRHNRAAYGEEGPNGKIRRYNAALRELAASRKVPLADFAAVEPPSDGAPLVAPDGVHLTPAGNRALAQCFLNALPEALREGETIVCLGDSVTYGAGNRGAGTAEGDTYPAALRERALPKREK